MNKVFLIGNLVKDPELVTTNQEGVNKCVFTIAVQRKARKEDGTHYADFIRISCWRAIADICAKYLAKGKRVAISGRIETGSYVNKEGKKIYTTDVVADDVEFLSPVYSNEKADTHKIELDDSQDVTAEDDLPF